MSVHVFHGFLGYNPTGTEHGEANELVEGHNLCLAHLDACVATVEKLPPEKKNTGWTSEEALRCTYRRLLLLTVEKLTKSVRDFEEN